MKKILALVIMTIITFSQLSAFAMAESAECACVINALTGDVVFSKNMNQKHAMASTTKIMTAIVAIERCNMDEIVDVSATAANQEGSAAYISEGNQYYMKDLLYGLMLNSGNDAAVAIAEHVSGSEESFAELMNEKAEELGLGNTHFMNPSGLDNPEHYTTVYNLALIARYAMTLPQFREIVATQTAQAQALKERLEKISGKTVLLTQKTDSTVLGGIRVELEGKQLDGTVQERLSSLKKKVTEIIV